MKPKVVVYGVGAIGSGVAKALLERGMEVVAAVDISPAKVGKDLAEVASLEEKTGIVVRKTLSEALESREANVVVHTTGSYLKDVLPQIEECISSKLSVVSTCEELSYPYYKHPEIAKRIDEKAKEAGVAVLGTGINPGFLMDLLPTVLTAPCIRVEEIRVTRVINSAKRRAPFQKKIGTGLTREEFMEKISRREITGHVGLVESIAMLSAALGLKLDDIVEKPPEPVIAESTVETPYTRVEPGLVAGLRSVAEGLKAGKSVITLDFRAYAGADPEYDEVVVRGEPELNVRIHGGVHGDKGTVGMVVNMVPTILKASPGLHTMIDLPAPRAAVST